MWFYGRGSLEACDEGFHRSGCNSNDSKERQREDSNLSPVLHFGGVDGDCQDNRNSNPDEVGSKNDTQSNETGAVLDEGEDASHDVSPW